MSVVVRMEMPENCECCPMVYTPVDVQGYHWCAALEQEVEEGLSRPKECPIICSLPEGHGRLVDAGNAFNKIVESSIDGYISNVGVYSCLQELNTIVPADTAERSET